MVPFRTAILATTFFVCIAASGTSISFGQKQDRFVVVAYFHGDTTQLTEYPLQKLTHLCYSFLHLKGNRLAIRSARDSTDILYLSSLRKKYPGLKILLSFGGWGGCKTCSDVFSSDSGRSEFAGSVLATLQEYSVDGIDLDWEYPSVEGFPGHRFTSDDRHNFTLLVRKLREVLDDKYEITFAAGATSTCLGQSIEWKNVMPFVNRVHLMTYDFVNGFSTVTGHHTALSSTPEQRESCDHAVRFLDSVGVPCEKIVLGLAFYARVWSNVENKNNGLYQPGTFFRYVSFRDFDDFFDGKGAFVYHWDSTAQAPFRYDTAKRLFATFDDRRSVALKVRYAFEHYLAGVMFWELAGDTPRNGLLDAIDDEVKKMEARTGAR